MKKTRQELYEIFVIEGEAGCFQSYIGQSECSDDKEFEELWNDMAIASAKLNLYIQQKLDTEEIELLDY